MTPTLLVIDDNRSVRDSLALLLVRRGYRVLTAEDGERGLALVQEQSVDGVLLDQHMPGMSGLAVCRALTTYAAQRGRPLPIWMMTGARTEALAAAAVEAGALVLLSKPFNYSDLYARLEAALNQGTGSTLERPPLV